MNDAATRYTDTEREQRMKQKPTITSFYKGTDIVTLPVALMGAAVSDASFSPFSRYVLLPGFCDVHVHLREPGFSYKETVSSGTAAGARGGYTALCAMPNLNPVPDSDEHLRMEEEKLSEGCISVYPYGAITVGERGECLSDLSAMAPRVVAFSDDGRGVQSESLMRQAMQRCRDLGKIVVAHCEDNSLLRGGYIHDGAYAHAHGHRGICSESEYGPIERDIRLVKETGCAYHVCHVSTKESVSLIRRAKGEGVNITCETAPHYLLLDDSDLREDGRYKMNPPLRSADDKAALIEGILDGTIDMIATDHAPHSAEEKSRGLEKSAFGIVGLETAFPLLYTEFVKKNLLSMEKLLDLMAYAPRRRFGIGADGYSLWDLEDGYNIDPEEFLSMGRSTPFEGRQVYGRCLMTVAHGKAVYVYTAP